MGGLLLVRDTGGKLRLKKFRSDEELEAVWHVRVVVGTNCMLGTRSWVDSEVRDKAKGAVLR